LDKISLEKRSKNMSAIKSKNTKPELIVRKHLRNSGVSYRCNVRYLPGKPDISIKKYKLALDVHGCFWHGHENCKNFRLPKSNTDFWEEKINSNVARDLINKQKLEQLGFTYFVVWECQLNELENSEITSFIEQYFHRKNTCQL
jgi:DNA mismatch endonuclease, patch repair protein